MDTRVRILLTGKNGYVGSRLEYLLKKKGYDVTGIARNDLDLTNKEDVDKWFENKSYDVVVHTAIKGGSRLVKDDINVTYDNITAFINLTNNKNKFKKLINFGSGAEIFFKNTPYGFSKHVIREFVLQTNNFYNLRIFNVFDEFEKNTRYIKTNIINYINHKPIEIFEDKLMDFFYMNDLGNLVDYYIDHDNLPKEMDCSYKEKLTLKNIGEIINDLNTYKVDLKILSDKIGDPYVGNNNIPIKLIGLEKGIKNTYNELLKNN